MTSSDKPQYLLRVFDAITLITAIVFFTGGVVFYKANGRPLWEISDLAPFGALLAVLCWLGAKKYSSPEAFVNQSKTSRVIKKTFSCLLHVSDKQFFCRSLLMAFSVSVIFFLVNLYRHSCFETGFDTAIFDQALFNTTRGKFHFSEIKGGVSLFSDHFQPILFTLLPLYWLKPSPVWLFMVQSSVVFFSSWGILKILLSFRWERKWIILILLAWWSYRPLRGVLINDFHPICLVIPCIIWAFYFLIQSRMWPMMICFFVGLMCKETFGIYLFFIGIYVCFASSFKKKYSLGILISVLGISSYFAITQWFMPQFGSEFVYTNRYSHFGTSPFEVVTNLLNPSVLFPYIFTVEKIRYLTYLGAPFLFAAFLRWKEWIILLPFLAQNLLSNFDSQYKVGTHYSAEACGLMVAGSLIVLNLRPRLRSYSMLVAAAICAVTFHGRSLPQTIQRLVASETNSQWVNIIEKNTKKSDVLELQSHLLPHFSSRNPVVLFPESQKRDYTAVSFQLKPWPLSGEEFKNAVSNRKKTGNVIFEDGQDLIIISSAVRNGQ